MSKMSDLNVQIQDLLDQGQTPFMIAQMLDVPVSWVYEVEENSPYATSNS
jgi:electron transfer flavoprotein alpha/beta subunit